MASIIWINAQTQEPQQAAMLLAKVSQHIVLRPLGREATLRPDQFVRVAIVEPQTRLHLRFNTRVIGPQGDDVLLHPPNTIQRDRRRDFERVSFQGPLSVKRPFEADWHPMEGIDLSVNGLAFATAMVFSPDERIQVLLVLSKGERVTVSARVVRHEKQRVAVALENLSPGDQQVISAYVLRHQSQAKIAGR